MKNKHYFTKALFATIMAIFFSAATAAAQCVVPIAPGQSYTEDFESGEMECWTVESTGSATWAVLQGTASNSAAFQNADSGEEARLISPFFDLSGSNSATFNFGYAMVGMYDIDELVVSYRSSETDNWHELDSYSFSDWYNSYEASFTLEDLTSTYQVSFLGRCNGGYYILIDNIEIVSVGGCVRPLSLEINEVTATSALVEWSTTGNEESWTIELNGNQRTVDTHPYLLDRLEPQTEYVFRVKANCIDEMESEWSYPLTFQTHCDVITVTDDQPYFDDFEASEDFLCWQDEIELGDGGWVVDPGYLIPNNTAFFIWLNEEAWLVSAPLDISAITNPVLTFKHRQKQGELGVDELSVWYAASDSDFWHLLRIYNYTCEDWETITLDLPDPSATYRIAFKGKSNNAEGVYVDDVWVGNDPSVGVVESSAFAVAVSPNPTNGNTMVEANILEGDVAIFDLFGRQLMSTTLHEGRAELDLSGVSKGIYVARITGVGGSTTIKLVKE